MRLPGRRFGVAAAALSYFNKELKDLTPEEAAYLAALPKGPNLFHPFRRTERATERRNWILGEMANNGFITRPQADAAKAKPLAVNIRSFGAHVFAADFFAEDVRRTLFNQFGEDKLYGGGLSVRTTLDPQLQRGTGLDEELERPQFVGGGLRAWSECGSGADPDESETSR